MIYTHNLKNNTNKQNRNKLRHREQNGCLRAQELREGVKEVEKLRSINWYLQNNGDVKYTTGNIVNNIAITMHGARWVLEISGRGEWFGRCLHIFFFYFTFFLLLFKYRCLHFSPPLSPTQHSPPPTLDPTLLWFCSRVLYTCSLTTLAPFSLLSPPTYLLVTVSLFLISVSVVTFCLFVCFVDQVPLTGEITWYLSFTAWLTSLSITLSSSTDAVVKSRSFFFLLHSIPRCKCTTFF